MNPRIVINTDQKQSKYTGKGIMESTRGMFYGWVNTDFSNATIAKAIWMNNYPAEGLEYATATFDANGGSGTMNPIVVQKDSTLTLPKCTFSGPNGLSFVGWKVGDDSKIYSVSDSVKIGGNTTVSAQWGMSDDRV